MTSTTQSPALPDLHAQVMNIKAKPYDGSTTYDAYCRGHRDARHAAAELALTADKRIAALEAELDSWRTATYDLVRELRNAAEALTIERDEVERDPDRNPWRASLMNCLEGSNYLRSGEYYRLVEDIDRLIDERDDALKALEQARASTSQPQPILETFPPFPGHPEPRVMAWSAQERATIEAYALQCALNALHARHGQPATPTWPAHWLTTGFNDCIVTASEALRHLARHERPAGAQSPFNSEHLLQIAGELVAVRERFEEGVAGLDLSPLERLRFFCSLAMSGQDWLDVEPLFDAIEGRPAAAVAVPAEFNISENVWVRLTDRGRQALKDRHNALPTEDADGWSKWQLWCLMEAFGDRVYLGCEMDFETVIRLAAAPPVVAQAVDAVPVADIRAARTLILHATATDLLSGKRSVKQADRVTVYRWLCEAAGLLIEEPVAVDAVQAVPEAQGEADARRKLAAFGAAMLRAHRNDGYPGDVDGGTLQDLALQFGVTETWQATEACSPENCVCAELGDFPTECHRIPDDVRDAMSATSLPGGGA